MKLLLDEHVSPRLVNKLAQKGVHAEHIVHVGRSGMSDPMLWRFAFVRDAVVVTFNVRDFLALAADTELHPGLIVVRASGLTIEEQWAALEPAVDWLLSNPDPRATMLNKILEVKADGGFSIYPLPSVSAD